MTIPDTGSSSRSRRPRLWLVAAAAFVALVAVAALVIPGLLDVERHRERIEASLEQATGWDVELGELGFSVLRGLAVTVEPLTLASPDGASGVEVELLEVHARLRPLLSGRLEIQRLELVRPSARLVRGAPDAPWPLPLPLPREDAPAGPSGLDVVIERIDVKGGAIVLEDRGGETTRLFRAEDVAFSSLLAEGRWSGSLALVEGGRLEFSGTNGSGALAEIDLDAVPTESFAPFVSEALVGPGGLVSGRVTLLDASTLTGTLRAERLSVLAGERPLDDVALEFALEAVDAGRWSATHLEIRAEGILMRGSGSITPDLDLSIDLPSTPLERALRTARAAFPLPLDLRPPGTVAATIDIERPEGGELAWTTRGTLAAGSVLLIESLPPSRDVSARFQVGRDGDLVVKIESGTLAGGPVTGTARLSPLMPPGRLVFDGKIGNAGLGPLVSGFVGQADSRIEGDADVAARIETDLSSGTPDLGALGGTVSLDARDITLPGWDLEQAIRARIEEKSASLGRLADAAARLDPKIAKALGGKTSAAAGEGESAAVRTVRSVFETLAVDVSFDGLPWSLERLAARTDAIAAEGRGRFDPRDGVVDVVLDVHVSAERTTELLARYPELDLLVAKDGGLVLPLALSGPMTKPGIKVDLAGLARQKSGGVTAEQVEEDAKEQIKEKARGLLDRLLDKRRPRVPPADGDASQGEESVPAPSPPEPGASDAGSDASPEDGTGRRP